MAPDRHLGVMTGLGSGAVAMVLGATVVNRWFKARRGLMMGLLSASTATGTLIFVPGMAAIAEQAGWRTVVLSVAAVVALLIPVVAFLMPDSPAAVYGAAEDEPPAPPPPANPLKLAFEALFRAARTPTFWLLFATFFVCGSTTNSWSAPT